jgi:hypothetical protein
MQRARRYARGEELAQNPVIHRRRRNAAVGRFPHFYFMTGSIRTEPRYPSCVGSRPPAFRRFFAAAIALLYRGSHRSSGIPQRAYTANVKTGGIRAADSERSIYFAGVSLTMDSRIPCLFATTMLSARIDRLCLPCVPIWMVPAAKVRFW